MALAELASRNYIMAPSAATDEADEYEYQLPTIIHGRAMFKSRLSKKSMYGAVSPALEETILPRVRRSVGKHSRQSNRPNISSWVARLIDLTALLSGSVVVVAFFVFLLELTAGRSAMLLSVFSSFFTFSIVLAVSLRLRRTMKLFHVVGVKQ